MFVAEHPHFLISIHELTKLIDNPIFSLDKSYPVSIS